MEHLVPPILLWLVLRTQLIHCFLSNRFAKILLQIVVVEDLSNFLRVFRKVLRTRSKSEIWIGLDPVRQVTFQCVDVLSNLMGYLELVFVNSLAHVFKVAYFSFLEVQLDPVLVLLH